MYDMTSNRLPAPYELNQSLGNNYAPNTSYTPSTSNALTYAKGGRTLKHKGMTAVHMNPHEIRIMDHLQGITEHGPNGVKMFPHLEDIFKNQHIVEAIHRHAHTHRAHHAHGGYTAPMQHLSQGGRNGDTELAMIGPRTEHLFNSLAGYPTKNPYTGHPEYFSIGPALSSMGNIFKGGASALGRGVGALGGALGRGAGALGGMLGRGANIAAPMIKNAATGAGNFLNQNQGAIKDFASGAAQHVMPLVQQTLNNKLGEDWGGLAGGMAQHAQDTYLPNNPESVWNQLGSAGGAAFNKYNQGYNPQEAAGYGINQFGQDIGGGVGAGLSSFGQGLSSGQDYRTAARQGGQDTYNYMGGNQGVRNSVRNVGNNLIQGGLSGGRQAAGNEMNNYMQRMMPRPQAANQQYGQQGQQNYGRQSQQGQQGYGQQNQQGYNPYEEENPYQNQYYG